jgi:hypothetical protein
MNLRFPDNTRVASKLLKGDVFKIDGEVGGIRRISAENLFANDVTYDELGTLITNGNLVPGQKYKITDYQTVHNFVSGLVNWDVTYLDEKNYGDIEPIIVTALNNNQLERVAYSTVFPQDIIHYYYPNTGGSANPSLDYIKGAEKGMILRRIDTHKNIDIGCDWRNVKWRRWALNANTWDSETTYAKFNIVKHPSTSALYISIVGSNTNNAVTDTAYWMQLGSLTQGAKVSCSMTTFKFKDSSAQNIPVDNDNYSDYYIVPLTEDKNYEHWMNFKIVSEEFTYLTNNIVYIHSAARAVNVNLRAVWGVTIAGQWNFGLTANFNMLRNVILGSINTTSINVEFSYNFISGDFSWNSLEAGWMDGNYIGGSLTHNFIGSAFRDNLIRGTVTGNSFKGGIFYTNVFTQSSTSCSYNSFSYNFTSNTVKALMTQCTFKGAATSNIFNGAWSFNTLDANSTSNTFPAAQYIMGGRVASTDFTGNTILNSTYQKWIVTNSAGTVRVMYYDGSNVATFVAPGS